MRAQYSLLIVFAALAPMSSALAEDRTGEQIYEQMCATCHGDRGQGTAEHKMPLVGDRSVGELAAFIDKEMPKDSPEECSAEDAQRVAAYIHDAFYSPVAQARNRPPRVELTRLTVRQHRNTVADLVGGFRREFKLDERRGLRGEYYAGRRMRGDRGRVLDRVDPRVEFDFGTEAPKVEKDADKFEAAEFSIRWSGSVLAPDTGDYEFVVRTEHAARLWVNDDKSPLIDAWVKSGDDKEFRGSINLLGGRAYPIKLEFSKAKQGVNDRDKKKETPKVAASIALLWKLPDRVLEVVPERALVPEASPEMFVLAAKFPPDDRSEGYERGASVSKAWDEAATDAAIEVANYVAARLPELADVRDDTKDRDQKLREFCGRFVERAFQRPLANDDRRHYVDRIFEKAPNADTAAKISLMLALKSPRFLYRDMGSPPSDHTVASRLALVLWDSIPDKQLWEAATAGRLSTRDGVAAEAERMTADPRARAKLRDFLLTWLEVERIRDLSKDTSKYPEFDAAVASDLRSSLDLFLDEIINSEKADFRELLRADYVHLNGRLAKIYGVDLPAEAPFQKVELDAGKRAGVITHPYVLAGFAYQAASSPIHRGVLVARNVFGRALRPPPEAVIPLAPELHPDLTTRQRVALQTGAQACQRCHDLVNSLGFALENFDAVGRFRNEEQGKPVDATGAYQSRTGETTKFDGAKQLAEYAAQSADAHTAVVEQMFHNFVKQPVYAYGERLEQVKTSFVQSDFNLRKLSVAIAVAATLQSESVSPTARPPEP
jgi:cytochrome c553